MSGYAHPEVLVSTRWVADHLDDPAVRFVEIETTTVNDGRKLTTL
jgi:3-mercaptopyruvate sulfurtransferase SseA